MSDTPYPGIVIEPQGQSTVVNITDAHGNTASAYSDRFGVSSVSFPDTISARTTLYLPGRGPWTVSAKVSGVELAGQAVTLEDGEIGTVTLVPPLSAQIDAYVGLPALTDTATQYVAAAGNDTNDGLSWHSAKATIQAAVNALPLSSDGWSRNGVVEVGYGKFTVSSTERTDTCTFTNGSTTVSDTSAALGDVGAYIRPKSNQGSLPGAYITAVTPGVSFTMNVAAIANITGTVFIEKPGVALFPGVTLRGRGPLNGRASWLSTNYGTQIQDNGTGIAVWFPVGAGYNNLPLPWPGTSADGYLTALKCKMEGVAVTGNTANQYGVYISDLTQWNIDNCFFGSNGQWGIYLDSNASNMSEISNTMSLFNGTATATVATGGLYAGQGAGSIIMARNCRFDKNYGYGAFICAGFHFLLCDFSNNQRTSFAGSGAGLKTTSESASGAGIISVDQCWCEASDGDGTATSAQFDISASTVMRGTLVQGLGSTNYSVRYTPHDTQTSLVMEGDMFGSDVAGCVYFNDAVLGSIYWKGLTVSPGGAGLPFLVTASGTTKELLAGEVDGNLYGGSNQRSFLPEDYGWKAWAYDPALCSTTYAPGASYPLAVGVEIRNPITVTNVLMVVETGGSGLTASENFAGIYTGAGALIASTADQTTAWGTTGLKTMALTSAQALTPGFYYMVFLVNGTTVPHFAAMASTDTVTSALGVATGKYRAAFGSANQSVLPASFGPYTTFAPIPWIALS